MNQSLREIEIVIVDDCSTDGSAAIIDEIKAKDSRVKLVRLTHNSGTHYARMAGVRRARGTFILSLDPDDLLLPFIAEDALHFALLHEADIVEFHALMVVNGSAHLFSFLNPPMIESDGETMAELFGNKKLNWNLWKRLIKREVYLKAVSTLRKGGKTAKVIYAEDKLHVGTLLLFTNGYHFLKHVGYIYFRDNPDNSESGTQQTKMRALQQFRYVDRMLEQMYADRANLTYRRNRGVPEGLGSASLLKRRRRRRRGKH
jgi:glycosyltransferase involved in cell wall biosynthesis